MDDIDIDILDIFSLWDFENESTSVQQIPSINYHPVFQMNDGVSIQQRSSAIQISPKKHPLWPITNSKEGTSLFDQKIQPPIPFSSPSSQPYVDVSSFTSPILVAKKPNGSMYSPQLRAISWSPLEESRAAVPDPVRSFSADVTKPNKKRKKTRNNVLEGEAKNPAIDAKTDPKRWTKAEDKVLETAVKTQMAAPYNWNLIASKFFAGSRTATQCKLQWDKRLSKRGNVRGNWTPEDDKLIVKMQSEGFTWQDIAKLFPHRSHEQIRDRYNDNLDPSLVRTPWTEAEDSILVDEQSRVGNKWSEIARKLPGRSTNQVKNRWYQQKRSPSVKSVNSPPAQAACGDSLEPKARGALWSAEEDSVLIQEQRRVGNQWKQISQLLPGRSANMIKQRWYQHLRPKEDAKPPKVRPIKSQPAERTREDSSKTAGAPWTAVEDTILIQEQGRLGNKWAEISKELPGRSVTQTKNRWFNLLQYQPPRLGNSMEPPSVKQIKPPIVKKPNVVEQPQVTGTRWTAAEDSILIKERHDGKSSWGQIAQKIPGRSASQAKNRWSRLKHLEPRAAKCMMSPRMKRKREDSLEPQVGNTPWTMEEDNILIQEQKRAGNKWTQISQLLPGRSASQIRNRWRTKICYLVQGEEFSSKDSYFLGV